MDEPSCKKWLGVAQPGPTTSSRVCPAMPNTSRWRCTQASKQRARPRFACQEW